VARGLGRYDPNHKCVGIMRDFDIEFKKAKRAFTRQMDGRQHLFTKLQSFFDRHGYVPVKYLADWNAYQKDTRHWRKIPGIERRIVKAAKKAARNAVRKNKSGGKEDGSSQIS